MTTMTEPTTDGPKTRTLADLLDDSDTDADVQPDQIELNDILDILQNERRRQALDVLANHAPIGKRDLADAVARRTADDPDDVSDDWEKTTYVTMHQNHLPKMKGYGVITVDEDTATVDTGPTFDAVVEIQARIDQRRVVTDAVEGVLGRIGKTFRS